LSNLFTFAIKKGIIQTHPMQRYGRLPEPQTVLRVMTLAEERSLVDAVMQHDPMLLCDSGRNRFEDD